MFIINPYDRYVSDNSSSSPDNTPSRARISFSRKAAPVVSITPTSAVSTGQENRSPNSSVPFPSSPLQVPSTQTCRDAIYIPCSDDLPSTPEQPESVPPTYSYRRQRSNSGLMHIQQTTSRPLATPNSDSRATVGFIDPGKSPAVLSITSSGTVSKVEPSHLSKTLTAARQRRVQQLDRKRNAPMVTRKQTKKASMDAKFLIILHHSITWHIERRSDVQGPSLFLAESRTWPYGNPRPIGSREVDAQDGLLAQRILQHLTQKGQIHPPDLGPEVQEDGTLMYPVPNPFLTSNAPAASPPSPSPSPALHPGPGIMTIPQVVAALHLRRRDRSTKPTRPRNPVARKTPIVTRRSPLSQPCS